MVELGGHHDPVQGSEPPSHVGVGEQSDEELDHCEDPDHLELKAGGVETMPLQDTFWNSYFGMCTDKFGVQWMVNVDLKSD